MDKLCPTADVGIQEAVTKCILFWINANIWVTEQKDVSMTVNSNDDPPNSDHVNNVVPVQRDIIWELPIGTVNPLVLELNIYSLAYHLCKMWIF